MVVCGDLGYKYGVRGFRAGTDIPGTGPIWLKDVDCTGSEESFTNCLYKSWGNNYCRHVEDAGVECSNTGTIFHSKPYRRFYFLTTQAEIRRFELR